MIISTVMAALTYVLARIISDEELVSLILALVAAILGTAAARAAVYTKPHARDLANTAWADGASKALFVKPPTPGDVTVVDGTRRIVDVKPH